MSALNAKKILNISSAIILRSTLSGVMTFENFYVDECFEREGNSQKSARC